MPLPTKDWLDWVVTAGIVGLAIDRWVHGRERVEDRQGNKIEHNRESIEHNRESIENTKQELKIETERLWHTIRDLEDRVANIGSLSQSESNKLIVSVEVLKSEMSNLKSQLSTLWKLLDRRKASGSAIDIEFG